MKSICEFSKDIKQKNKGIKSVIWVSIVFLMIITFNLTSYAFVGPNIKKEIEPNDTQETAQITQPTNEIAVKFAAEDWSGRYRIDGKATSLDDDWYKVNLSAGIQYLSVAHFTVGYSGARVTSSSSPTSITFNKTPLSGNIGSLGMELKSRWDIEYYSSKTVTSVPIVDYLYFYPVYDNTVYPHLPTIMK